MKNRNETNNLKKKEKIKNTHQNNNKMSSFLITMNIQIELKINSEVMLFLCKF